MDRLESIVITKITPADGGWLWKIQWPDGRISEGKEATYDEAHKAVHRLTEPAEDLDLGLLSLDAAISRAS